MRSPIGSACRHGRRRRSASRATLLATGCLHEDGLADTADGFGGGETREQKLDIMRDSRIGVYGVCALIVSLLLRVGLLASLPNAHLAVWALIASHAAARATMPALSCLLLPPARNDGLSFEAGRPPGDSVAAARGDRLSLARVLPWHPARGIVARVSSCRARADGVAEQQPDRRPDRRRLRRARTDQRDHDPAGRAGLNSTLRRRAARAAASPAA